MKLKIVWLPGRSISLSTENFVCCNRNAILACYIDLNIILFITQIHRVRFVSVNERASRVKSSKNKLWKEVGKKIWKKNFEKKNFTKQILKKKFRKEILRKSFRTKFWKKNVRKKILIKKFWKKNFGKKFRKKNVGKINYKRKIFINKIYSNIDISPCWHPSTEQGETQEVMKTSEAYDSKQAVSRARIGRK